MNDFSTDTQKDVHKWISFAIPWLVRIARIVLAFFVLFVLAVPIADTAKKLLKKEVDKFILVDSSDTQPNVQQTPQADKETMGPKATEGSAAKTMRETTHRVRSASRVWAYGLQILGMVTALGIISWVILALIRFE